MKKRPGLAHLKKLLMDIQNFAVALTQFDNDEDCVTTKVKGKTPAMYLLLLLW